MSEKKATKKAETKETKPTKEEKLMGDIRELIDDILDVKEEFDKKGIFADVSSLLGGTSAILGAVIAKKLVDDGNPIIADEECDECCCEGGDNVIILSDNAVLSLDRFINTHFIDTIKTDDGADMDYVSGVGEVHDCINEIAADIYSEYVEDAGELGRALVNSLIAIQKECCSDCKDGDTEGKYGDTENKEEK